MLKDPAAPIDGPKSRQETPVVAASGVPRGLLPRVPLPVDGSEVDPQEARRVGDDGKVTRIGARVPQRVPRIYAGQIEVDPSRLDEKRRNPHDSTSDLTEISSSMSRISSTCFA